ncbi:MAG: acyl carrier protein [Mangrovibacterium sp.]
MEIHEFVQNFAAQFDETDVPEFNAETAFREIDEWSSLTSLSIIAMVDEKYNVKLTGNDIRSSKTIQDIFEKVKAKV